MADEDILEAAKPHRLLPKANVWIMDAVHAAEAFDEAMTHAARNFNLERDR